MMGEWRISKDVERSGRGLILRNYPDIYLEGLKKTRNPSATTASLRAEIWTRDLPNMKQIC
jgi:hypothetical protein